MTPDAASDDWNSWIGRRRVSEDIATPRLLAEYRSTLHRYLFAADDPNACPPGFHWALAPATPAMAETGGDGSEARDVFLPPIRQSRRMWAGGQIETLAPVLPGLPVKRTSTIADIKSRSGKSGDLYFVSIRHEIESGGRPAVRERQDLVFRDGGSLAGHNPGSEAPLGGLQWQVDGSPLLLFRFSAFTFNGHRIHYDHPYALAEGYDGLLVHGPLQAALMLNQAAITLGEVPRLFDYRCMAPLFGSTAFTVSSERLGGGVRSRITRHDGVTTAEARVPAPGT